MQDGIKVEISIFHYTCLTFKTFQVLLFCARIHQSFSKTFFAFFLEKL